MVNSKREIHIDKLSLTGFSPGYRQITFEVTSVYGNKCRIDLSIEDSMVLAREILVMNDLAWDDDTPIDSKPNEIKPSWVGEYMKRPFYGRLYKKESSVEKEEIS